MCLRREGEGGARQGREVGERGGEREHRWLTHTPPPTTPQNKNKTNKNTAIKSKPVLPLVPQNSSRTSFFFFYLLFVCLFGCLLACLCLCFIFVHGSNFRLVASLPCTSTTQPPAPSNHVSRVLCMLYRWCYIFDSGVLFSPSLETMHRSLLPHPTMYRRPSKTFQNIPGCRPHPCASYHFFWGMGAS